MDYTRICIHCLNEKDHWEDICPHCGFDPHTYKMKSYVLPPMTVLNGKYILGEVLGAGGFGITYAALDLRLERRVAIKEFYLSGGMYRKSSETTNVSYSDDNLALSQMVKINMDRFEKEAKLLARVEALPGIVRVYEIFNENRTCYIVMEYLEGVTLKQYVRDQGGCLPVKDLLGKLFPLMDSLVVLHEQSILHRDISPDNIMVMKHGGMVLFDFGGAKVLGNESAQYSIMTMVKNGFSPIEQVYNDKQGPWTDEYALAATIYYCITGKVPVNSGERVLDGDTLQPPSALGITISKPLESVLLKGLAVKKTDRYPDVRVFKDELKKAVSAPEKKERKLPSLESLVKEKDSRAGEKTVASRNEAKSAPSQNEEKSALSHNKARSAVTDTITRKETRFLIFGGAGILVCILLISLILGSRDRRGESSEGRSAADSVVLSEETAASREETAASSEEAAASSEETAASSEVAASREETAASEEAVASSEETAVFSEETSASSTAADDGNVSESDYEASSENEEKTDELPETLQYDGFEYSINEDETVTITGWSGSSNNAEIPKRIDGHVVTTIGENAFLNCSELNSIDMPDTILVIGDGAFKNCTGLGRVWIPRFVEKIGKSVFAGCKNLKKISVSRSNEYYSNIGMVLYDKNKTSLISFPPAIEYGVENGDYAISTRTRKIEEMAFAFCPGTINIIIPASVSRIADDAFYECSATLIVDRGSYAEEYAKDKGIEYLYSDETDSDKNSLEPGDYEIDWKDSSLEKAMMEVTGITDRRIRYSDVKDITNLKLVDKDIHDISALKDLTAITHLNLSHNKISDILALGNLLQLTVLILNDNEIDDVSVIKNLSGLIELNIRENPVTDVSSLENLPNLKRYFGPLRG